MKQICCCFWWSFFMSKTQLSPSFVLAGAVGERVVPYADKASPNWTRSWTIVTTSLLLLLKYKKWQNHMLPGLDWGIGRGLILQGLLDERLQSSSFLYVKICFLTFYQYWVSNWFMISIFYVKKEEGIFQEFHFFRRWWKLVCFCDFDEGLN